MQLVQRIHNSGIRMVLAVTGGGSGAISTLLTLPGASRTMLEARVPYCATALTEWLGQAPEQFCSAETARAMAMAAWLRGRSLAPGESNIAGVACTASLASDRPKRGPHRAHLAIQTAKTTAAWSLDLSKGQRSRAEEEDLVSALILDLIAEVAAIDERPAISLLPGDNLTRDRVEAPREWQELLAGECHCMAIGPARVEPPRALFPGAFNPFHDGHQRMAAVASEILGDPVNFELTIKNVDKPPLDFLEIAKRAKQFDRKRLWLTRMSTFVEKAECFPNTTFVVGADTIVRIADPRYAGEIDEVVDRLVRNGARFLVFGRTIDGKFQGLANMELPGKLRELCREVPASMFREDISSTELRRQTAPQ